MVEYTIFTDFNSLSKKDASNWVSNCRELVDEAFKVSSNKVRLLGNLLVLE